MSETEMKVRILFVCMGNICRSPTAHAVFRERVRAAGLSDRIEIDSAGTHDYHVGHAPDRRACEAAADRGYDLSDLRARRIEALDLTTFDYVLAMDAANLALIEAMLEARARQSGDAEVRRFLDYVADGAERDVPDPYYGAGNGFEQVLDLVENGADCLLAHLRRQHGF